MNEKSKTTEYLDYLNENILSFIDYDKLHTSYKTDMVYAKGILNLLHEAMIKIYGDEYFERRYDLDDCFVVIPGVLRNEKTGNICLALLQVDLASSGEFYGADYLCKSGVISQSGYEGQDEHITAMVNKTYIPFDYCYTATIPCDHHVEKTTLPKELKSILKDFRQYKTNLIRSSNTSGEER